MIGADEIYRYAREAGFSPDQATTMTAIALAESHGNPEAHNPNGEDSWGLWQVNVSPDANSQFAGVDLTDPRENAKAAFAISRRGTDISPWTVTHGRGSARYLQYQDEAQAAATHNRDP